MIRLWLDDLRDPTHHGRVGWTWVKTADEAIALLQTGRVVQASLDHDLDIHATLGLPPTTRTGYDVVLWMDANNVYPPCGVDVHSMNPTGRPRMIEALHALHTRLASTRGTHEGPHDD